MESGKRAPPGIKGPPGNVKRQKHMVPTVQEIVQDSLTPVANAYWATGAEDLKPYNADIIDDIYKNELADKPLVNDRVMLLELSGYLENYLWPNFDDKTATFAHVLSIVMLVNEKFRQSLLDVWSTFHQNEEKFQPFLKRVWSLKGQNDMSLLEKTAHLQFVIHAFQSLEDPIVRASCLRLTSPILWQSLTPATLKKQIKIFPAYKKFLRKMAKHNKKTGETGEIEKNFLPDLIHDFFLVLKTVNKGSDFQSAEIKASIHYCERFLEFMVDLLSQLPTRRFFLAVVKDTQFSVLCQLSDLSEMGRTHGRLFCQLLKMLNYYVHFEIDDSDGSALTDDQMRSEHYQKLQNLQVTAFKTFPKELEELATLTVDSIHSRSNLTKYLGGLSAAKLRTLGEALGVLTPLPEGVAETMTREILLEILVNMHEKRDSQKRQVKQLPLYPTDQILWDENLVPTQNYTGEGCLALPKLNLQFLTFHDYLLRNFNLYRLESTYEIREDIGSTVFRLRPRLSAKGETIFTGDARMAIPIYSFSITQVKKPKIGETKPALVRAEITVDLSPFRHSRVRDEWEELREHDVLFLLTVRATPEMKDAIWKRDDRDFDWSKINKDVLGIKYVRGCELVRVLDEEKKVVGEIDGNGNRYQARGNMRTYQVQMDRAQYEQDMAAMLENDEEDPHTTFNLLLRRKAKENNFRAVLATIRDLMEGEPCMPTWLKDVFLGYGNPHAAQYYSLEEQLETVSFRDTFQDVEHMKDSFADKVVAKESETDLESANTFYEFKFPKGTQPDLTAIQTLKTFSERAKANDQNGGDVEMDGTAEQNQIGVQLVSRPKVWGEKFPKRNLVRFTPMQVEAIKSGINPGLTMVVGPPGTGKTDTAVQMISELYHNFPDQRVLLVTHSNHALNDLFEKIMERDIDERYLLRLGRGQDFLESEKDFSKFGRVNHMLNRRLELLEEVTQLATAMDIKDDVGSTCETAGHFFLYHVTARWEQFLSDIKGEIKEGQTFSSMFPFTQHFVSLDPEAELFKEDGDFTKHMEHNMEVAHSCWRYLERKFKELEETKPFELMRTGKDRGTYLLTKHAKVIAMTCTHAAINRPNFIKWGFQFDNIIMEEAAQILEIETFIPMMIQEDDNEFGSRLKRVIMLGDHHQLPPVIKNRAFQKFCHMDQSLFTRMVRLGMPYIQLNAQGRMRPTLANLWNWRYENLCNLPNVMTDRFKKANAGLRHEFQLINVGDFNGQGESSPQPHFFQNLGEAEYVVQMYMYLRLIGVPASKISIITTYNGQKALIRDVAAARCNEDPLFGPPAKITTVDKFQGQQNDFILISLVRTRTAGHIRDIRRLVVAMSRARLGLYVFCRKKLFMDCFELAKTFNVLHQHPSQLILVPGEQTTDGLAESRNIDDDCKTLAVKNVEHMGKVVDDLKKWVQSQWALYQKRVEEYHQKLQEEQELREKREAEAKAQREQAAREEAEELRKVKKAAEYEKLTEDYMEQTAKRVEEREAEAAMDDED